ncbi:MAG: DUF2461 domain-containing protein [Bacteroidia bacterium]|nr:DUF2461 domain-containing protein [Bacteroidia bacterium]
MAKKGLALTFDFLQDLAQNNHRDWFTANKSRYEDALAAVTVFADELLALMQTHDHIETPSGKKSLFRIYRDVRFSKDKAPYKTHWGGSFTRATAALRGGYYFHLEPGNSFMGGGFWAPNNEDLLRIRKEIAADGDELKEILAKPAIKNTFGDLHGEQLKTAPKGFEKDHPHVDLLRYKQFILTRKFTDKEVLGPNAAELYNEAFKGLRPFFDYMSAVLTTDENGIPLV